MGDSKPADHALELIGAAFDALSTSICLLDTDGMILLVNRAWTEFAKANSGSPDRVGQGINYLEMCDAVRGEDAEQARAFAAGIRSVLSKASDGYAQEYACHSIAEHRWFIGRVTRFEAYGQGLVLVEHTDITESRLTEARLQASLAGNEALLSNVRHRIKNNFQVISSLLYLQSCTVTHPEAFEALRGAQNRIRTMALVHERPFRSSEPFSVNIAKYFTEIGEHLLVSYLVDRARIDLVVDVEDSLETYFDTERAIPCGLIVNELVSNALKYAFAGRVKGEIGIELRTAQNGDRLMLTVADNGVGFPPDVDLRKGQAFGLKLVENLARQLKGEAQISSRECTRLSVLFPKRDPRYSPRSSCYVG